MAKLFPNALVLNLVFFRTCLGVIGVVISAFAVLHLTGFGRPR